MGYGHLALTGVGLIGYLAASAVALVSGVILRVKARRRR